MGRRCPAVRLTALAVVACVALLGAGCQGSNGAASPRYRQAVFRPSDFVDPRGAGNPWFRLIPGRQLIRQGTTLIGNRKVPYQVITTVTDVTRMISGVQTVLVYDSELGTGQTTQRSLDYLAQDKAGNLWLMGSATESFEAGRFVDVSDVWISGVEGAKPGILFPADPVTAKAWVIGTHPGEKAVAQFVAIRRNCVPFSCFDKVLVTREGTDTAPNNELKYYALGLGQVRNDPQGDSRHDDTELLFNAIQLSPKGLTEANIAARLIDQRAAHRWPKFYNSTAASQRP